MKRKSASKGDFAKRNFANRRANKILNDIVEARSYGIELSAVTLPELYHYLKLAREQYRLNPHAAFDNMEDSQMPSGGLDELQERVLKKRKRARSSNCFFQKSMMRLFCSKTNNQSPTRYHQNDVASERSSEILSQVSNTLNAVGAMLRASSRERGIMLT